MNFDFNHSDVSGRDINSRNVTNSGTYINTMISSPTSAASSSGLPHLPRCPLPSKNFIGRTDELNELEQFFFNVGGSEGKRLLYALIGMGGCGKSQIAFSFLHNRVSQRFTSDRVFFIDATSTTTLEASYAAIAKSKGCGSTAQEALSWMAHQTEQYFLLIDNADDPDIDLYDYFPRSTNALVLITTRLRIAGQSYATDCKYLDALPQEEAERLLIKTARLSSDKCDLVATLVQELHCHALAVVQAGAGIANLQITVEEYREEFHKLRTKLMDGEVDGVKKHAMDGYPANVYTTWMLSYQKLSKLATSLVRLCAHLHHSGITEALFERAYKSLVTFSAHIPLSKSEAIALSRVQELLSSFTINGTWNSLNFKRCIQEICGCCLFDYDTSTRLYSIHPLILDCLKSFVEDRLDTGFLLWGAAVSYQEDVLQLVSLAPHVENMLGVSPVDSTIPKHLVIDWHPDLCVWFASVLWNNGQYNVAETLQRHTVERTSSALGDDDLDSIRASANLALTLYSQGRWHEAASLQDDTLKRCSRCLGEDDPTTLFVTAEFAHTVRSVGRLDEAEVLLRKVFDHRTVQLGKTHPDTLTAMGNLADTLRLTGRCVEAQEMEEEVLKQRRAKFGDNHPATMTALAHLATTLGQLGRWAEAEALDRQVLEQRIRRLGEDHPDTVRASANLAVTLFYLGRLDEAGKIERQVLEKRHLRLGRDHPQTIDAMANLASTLCSLGQLDEADEMGNRVLDHHLGMYGDDSTRTDRAKKFLEKVSALRKGS